jgi:hypothetical protein
MTEESNGGIVPINPATDWASYVARQAILDEKAASLRPANHGAIFDALADAGTVSVTVTFDGYGDSGQIEAIDARSADGEIALPDTCVEIASPACADPDLIERRSMPLAEAIETIAYDLLRLTHPGWENNEGAHGDFTFDVATRTISLEHHERYTAIESHSHVF